MKQKNPESLDAAVTATLEMEAYATTRSSVHPVSSVADEPGSEEATVGAVGTTNKLAAHVEMLVERVERLESGRKER